MNRNKIKIVALYLLITLLSGCGEKNSVEHFNYYVSQSLKYKNEGSDVLALKEINLALSIDSNQSFVYIIRGQIKSLLNDDSSAITDYSRAIKINPKSTSALFFKGLSYSNLDKEDSAISNFTAALETKKFGTVSWDIKENPFSKLDTLSDIPAAAIQYYRGVSQYNKKNDLEALIDFEYSAAKKYKIGESTFYIGVILLSQGRIKEGCAKLLESKTKGAEQYLSKYCK